MRRLSLLLCLYTLSIAATACDPIRSVRGTVHTVPEPELEDESPDNPYAAQTPVADATIEYYCPGHTPQPLRIESDDDGNFEYSGVGLWHKPCRFRVTHDDYYPQEFRVDELCLYIYGQSCHTVVLQAELLPRDDDLSADEALVATHRTKPPPEDWRDDRPHERILHTSLLILGTQAAIFAYSFPARWRGGAYFSGVMAASTGLTALLSPLQLTGWRRFTGIPTAALLGALSYYNFRYAAEHEPNRKFWMNYGGWNASLLLAIGTSLVVGAIESDGVRVEEASAPREGWNIGFTGTAITVDFRF